MVQRARWVRQEARPRKGIGGRSWAAFRIHWRKGSFFVMPTPHTTWRERKVCDFLAKKLTLASTGANCTPLRLRVASGALVLVVALLAAAGCGVGPIVTGTATPPLAPTAAPTATATVTPMATATTATTLDHQIDAYIAQLTPAQQIGQTLMLAVYANGYDADLAQALTQWHLGSAIIFPIIALKVKLGLLHLS